MYVIISSIISAASAIFVCILTQVGIARRQAMQIEKQTALIDIRITQLTNQVEKHNNVIERTYSLEKMASVCHEKMEFMSEKIDDLEKGVATCQKGINDLFAK